jgi:alpha-beta hydrolase superfamily lysophospholipase
MTIAMKRPNGRGGTFNYFDLYAGRLPAMGVGFFRYEGRGVTMGDKPPRYEQIDSAAFNTSSLENKVKDVESAVAIAAKQAGVDAKRIFLMGASEGTLLAAEAATRAKPRVAGLVLYGAMSGTMREVFRYIMTDGGFLAYRGFFDTDGDGRVSAAEFEADPRKYRARVFRNAPFSAFDRDGDSSFTAADMPSLVKLYLDAIDTENYLVLDNWARTSAAVATPVGWFKDHFHHPPIGTFLAKLDIPIGVFHGELDPATPVAGVRRLEAWAKETGKAKMEFHYFAGAEHTLGIGSYFTSGEIPPGHAAIFAFIERLAADPEAGR